MKEHIVITIITVCYNAKHSIRATMNNVMQLKSRRNVEYIVIDGQSDDGTKDIIKEYEENIDYYLSEPDDGIYDAMNKGIIQANGDIIGFLNCGDFYEEHALDEVIDIYIETNADVIYGNVTITHNNKNVGIIPASIDPSDILSKIIACHQGIFVKSEVYKNHKFDTRYKMVADRKMLLDLYLQGYKFARTDKNLAYYDDSGISFLNASIVRFENNRLTYKTYIEFPHLYTGKRQKYIDDIVLDAFFLNISENGDVLDKVIEYFVKDIDMKSKVFIWGAGRYGEKAENFLSYMGYEVAGYLDTNPSIRIKGKYKVMLPSELQKDDKTVIVISSSKYSDEIINCLKKHSNLADIPFFVFHKILIEYEKQSDFFKQYKSELLSDENSMALQYSTWRDL